MRYYPAARRLDVANSSRARAEITTRARKRAITPRSPTHHMPRVARSFDLRKRVRSSVMTDLATLIVNFVMVLTGVYKNGSGPSGLLTIPEGLWELLLGIYCAWKGFRTSSPVARPEMAKAMA